MLTLDYFDRLTDYITLADRLVGRVEIGVGVDSWLFEGTSCRAVGLVLQGAGDTDRTIVVFVVVHLVTNLFVYSVYLLYLIKIGRIRIN